MNEMNSPRGKPRGIFKLFFLNAGISEIRNRVIASAFQETGLIEGWGRGIINILAATAAAKMVPPKFEEVGEFFKVTFSKEPYCEDIDLGEEKILKLVRHKGAIQNKDVQHLLMVHRTTATKKLQKILRRGLLVVSRKRPCSNL